MKRTAFDTHFIRFILACFTFLVSVGGCTTIPTGRVEEFISLYGNEHASPWRFEHCSRYGCQTRQTIGFSKEQWEAIRGIFSPPSKDAADERDRISRVIGLMESFTGPMTGTANDKGGTFEGLFREGQLDCVDEAINTGTFLFLMKREGLIRYHELRGPAYRGWFIVRGWPHVAPVIIEHETGRAFVVDSWFFDNGQPAVIIPFDLWVKGWRPPKEPRL